MKFLSRIHSPLVHQEESEKVSPLLSISSEGDLDYEDPEIGIHLSHKIVLGIENPSAGKRYDADRDNEKTKTVAAAYSLQGVFQMVVLGCDAGLTSTRYTYAKIFEIDNFNHVKEELRYADHEGSNFSDNGRKRGVLKKNLNFIGYDLDLFLAVDDFVNVAEEQIQAGIIPDFSILNEIEGATLHMRSPAEILALGPAETAPVAAFE